MWFDNCTVLRPVEGAEQGVQSQRVDATCVPVATLKVGSAGLALASRSDWHYNFIEQIDRV